MVATAIAPESRLFSPRQTYVAAYIGGPLAAAWLLSRNFATSGSTHRATRVLWLAFAVTVPLLVIAFNLPDSFPNFVLPIAYSTAIYAYANAVFGPVTTEHFRCGGRKGSWGVVVLASALGLLILLGEAAAAVLVIDAVAGAA